MFRTVTAFLAAMSVAAVAVADEVDEVFNQVGHESFISGGSNCNTCDSCDTCGCDSCCDDSGWYARGEVVWLRRTRSSNRTLTTHDTNNEIWMDRKQVKPQGVRAQIERMHAENPEGSVIIQADKGSHSETLLLVLEAARDAKVSVAISAEN